MKKKLMTIATVALIVITIFYINSRKPETTDKFLIDPTLYEDWQLLILVNENNQLSNDFVPQDLVELNNLVRVNDNRLYLANKNVAKHLIELLQDFKKSCSKNYDIRVTSAYRSYDIQKNLYDRVPEYKRKGYVATPGCSEHQTGLAIDIAQAGVRSSQLQHTEFYKYLQTNAHKHGFIIRYPEDKQWQTGVKFEPWHIRYVGKKHAVKIYESKLTYEEYWQSIYNKIYTL